ncbi:glycosyltransferase [Tissierella sp. MB52-C2]|uniref:MGDG synthase family glycosyltransferase n=1 Tax=Tissierella sp. MB52-C2 TaxID=3070999 RepID=UPI00280B8800|nr:glycosyltransferase [Tissierella sp. MB52-C2]WMM24117.1 glycosyltransferase [Tissierella sp. MB52-C2]
MDHKVDILILTAGFGAGHLSAAIGIKENIQKIDGTIGIEVTDAFQILIPRLSKAMYKGYNILIRKGSRIYNHFHYKDNEKPKSGTSKFSNKYIINRLKNYIMDINPKLIISTFPTISQYLSRLKDKSEISIPLITCITDVVNGWEWITPNCDIYFVATKYIKSKMIDMGIEDERIVVTGIPLRKEFLELPRPLTSCYLPKGHMIIMIMGGGVGLIPNDKAFYHWIDNLNNTTTVVLAGKNEELYESISKLKLENVIPLRYTDQVPSIMAQSDLLVSKAGGITLFEAIASKLPFIVYKPELGQEIENSKFVCEKSIGDIALTIEELKFIITDLTNNKNRIDEYKRNLTELRKNINMDILAEQCIDLLRN